MSGLDGSVVERVRFTLLASARPRLNRTVTVAAPDGCFLGLEVGHVWEEPDGYWVGEALRRPVGRIRLGLSVSVDPDGPLTWLDGVEEAQRLAALVHGALHRTAGRVEMPDWAVEAWVSGAGVGPGRWGYLCAPWTTGCQVEPYRVWEAEPGGWGEAARVPFWKAGVRAGSVPWPEHPQPVHSARGVVQVRPDTALYRLEVDLPPPAADIPVAPAPGR